jgi:hypothetical protein
MKHNKKLIIEGPFDDIPESFSSNKKKRILWLGTRKIAPDLKFKFNLDSNKTFEEYLNEESIYPACLVWETSYGERKYGIVKYDN